MNEDIVLTHKENGIATITLNRPDALNALSTAMRKALTEALADVKDDDSISAIILTGTGRAFCAGLDLKELGDSSRDESENRTAVSDTNLKDQAGLLGKPVIGAINGFAITGGFELALMSDFIVASTEAQFADTHSQVGLVPGWGLSQTLPRLIGLNRAKEISFTGRFIDASTAERWGLVNHVVEPDNLLPFCQSLAEDIVSAEQGALHTIKKIMDTGFKTTLTEGLKIELDANKAHMDNVSPEYLEERRKIVMARGRKKSQ